MWKTIAVATCFAGVFAGAAAAQDALTPQVLDTIQAVLLRNHVTTAKQAECIIFMQTTETPAYIEVELREKHGGACAGEPTASPHFLEVRYDKRTHTVSKENDAMTGYDRMR